MKLIDEPAVPGRGRSYIRRIPAPRQVGAGGLRGPPPRRPAAAGRGRDGRGTSRSCDSGVHRREQLHAAPRRRSRSSPPRRPDRGCVRGARARPPRTPVCQAIAASRSGTAMPTWSIRATRTPATVDPTGPDGSARFGTATGSTATATTASNGRWGAAWTSKRWSPPRTRDRCARWPGCSPGSRRAGRAPPRSDARSSAARGRRGCSGSPGSPGVGKSTLTTGLIGRLPGARPSGWRCWRSTRRARSAAGRCWVTGCG